MGLYNALRRSGQRPTSFISLHYIANFPVGLYQQPLSHARTQLETFMVERIENHLQRPRSGSFFPIDPSLTLAKACRILCSDSYIPLSNVRRRIPPQAVDNKSLSRDQDLLPYIAEGKFFIYPYIDNITRKPVEIAWSPMDNGHNNVITVEDCIERLPVDEFVDNRLDILQLYTQMHPERTMGSLFYWSESLLEQEWRTLSPMLSGLMNLCQRYAMSNLNQDTKGAAVGLSKNVMQASCRLLGYLDISWSPQQARIIIMEQCKGILEKAAKRPEILHTESLGDTLRNFCVLLHVVAPQTADLCWDNIKSPDQGDIETQLWPGLNEESHWPLIILVKDTNSMDVMYLKLIRPSSHIRAADHETLLRWIQSSKRYSKMFKDFKPKVVDLTWEIVERNTVVRVDLTVESGDELTNVVRNRLDS